MIKGIEHIAVCSKNTKALTDWYVKMFGFKIVYDNGKGTYFVAANDGSMIEIVPADTASTKSTPNLEGIRHFALSVEYDNFEKMVDLIIKDGREIVTEAKTSASGVKTFFFRDIDGNIFHLIARLKPLL